MDRLTALQRLGLGLAEAERLLALYRAWKQAEWTLLDDLERVAARYGREKALAVVEALGVSDAGQR